MYRIVKKRGEGGSRSFLLTSNLHRGREGLIIMVTKVKREGQCTFRHPSDALPPSISIMNDSSCNLYAIYTFIDNFCSLKSVV